MKPNYRFFHFNKIFIANFIILLLNAGTNIFGQQKKPVLKVPMGHQQIINSIAFSTDGKLLATASADNTFIIWDTKTGFELRKIKIGQPVHQIFFSPDASFVVTVSGQNTAGLTNEKLDVKSWDTKTGKLLNQYQYSGLPTQLIIPASENILVAENSADMQKIATAAGNMNFTDPTNINNYTSTINYDSIGKAAAKHGEDLVKKMGSIDINDPKAVEELRKNMMKEIMGNVNAFNPLQKNFIQLDPRTLKPTGQLSIGFENANYIRYDNIDYFISLEKETDYSTRKTIHTINIWELDKLKKSQPTKALPVKKIPLSSQVYSIATSPAKGFFTTLSRRNASIHLWKINEPALLKEFSIKGKSLIGTEFSRDGNKLYTYSSTYPETYIEVWNTTTYQQENLIQLPLKYFTGRIISEPSGESFLLAYMWNLVRINNAGDSTGEFRGRSSSPSYYGFTPNEREVYINYYGFPDMRDYLLVSTEAGVEYEAYRTGKILTKEEKEKLVKQQMQLLPPATSQSYNGYNLIWDLTHGGAIVSKANAFSTGHKTISDDKKYHLENEKFESGNRIGNPHMKELLQRPVEGISKETAEKLKKYKDPNGIYYKLMFADYLNSPVTLLINKKTNDSISLIKIDSLDWIMTLKNNYYMTSKNGAKALSYVSGIQVYPFEQFDLKYNRPDKVLKAIGLAEPALLEAYRMAYIKRIKKAGIDTLQFKDEFELPEADINNRNQISNTTKTQNLKLDIIASDKNSNLDRYNIWVNEVPLFGKNGKSLKSLNSKKLNTTVNIILSKGTNKIETSVTNIAGVESYRIPLLVNFTPDQDIKETLHFIGIGIDKFADSKYNLQYSAKDIRDLSKKLKEKYGSNIIIDTFLNEDVTVAAIKSLKQKLLKTNENDKVVIAYSGHGLLSKEYDYYLSTYSINFEKPEEGGLSYDDLENLLDSIPARKKLMLIDACHSGEVDKEDLVALNASSDSLIKGLKPVAYKKENQLGLKNSFELMQSLFVNVGKSTGATIISAAAGTQFALERNDLKNGVFTFSILEAMKQYSTMKISQLKKIVGERVEQLTKGMQKPTSRNETIAVDWSMW
ncbi:hypothetical protein CAP36_04980 [Chitinophagaceae bacterium IBVUCB2]|nr:hypothetical protein CAP36_04980 [Chitinophagaceae bacterium IBVUCB2]